MRVQLCLLAALVLALGLAAWLLARPLGEPTPTRPTKGFVALDPAVAFEGLAPVDGTGEAFDLEAYRGKALLVNLWATWCAPCVAELPSLSALQRKLGGPQFAVLPIAVDERDPAKVAAFLERHHVDLPAVVDLDRGIDRVLAVTALPTSLLVDREGLVRAFFVGDTRWDCGRPLEAVSVFIATGALDAGELTPCQ